MAISNLLALSYMLHHFCEMLGLFSVDTWKMFSITKVYLYIDIGLLLVKDRFQVPKGFSKQNILL